MPDDSTPAAAPQEGTPPADPSAPRRAPTRSLRPAGAPGLRPAPVPPGPAKGGGLRAYLMLAIILSSLVLSALIALRLYQKYNQKPPVTVDVAAEWKAAFGKGKKAAHDIFEVEGKVWLKGEELAPADLDGIKAGLKTLTDADADL